MNLPQKAFIITPFDGKKIFLHQTPVYHILLHLESSGKLIKIFMWKESPITSDEIAQLQIGLDFLTAFTVFCFVFCLVTMTESVDHLENNDAWDELCSLPVEFAEKRTTCRKCMRPQLVCWCRFLPTPPVKSESRLILLQHPAEERRCLRTAPMLTHGLVPGKCMIYVGKKFPLGKHKGLEEILTSQNTVLLYPGIEATDLMEVPSVRDTGQPYNLVIIDGTWTQARSMYFNSPLLHQICQVKLNISGGSEYVVRTQPNEGCVSTVEAAAWALSVLEGRPEMQCLLVRPLQALCDFQLNHGAVTHHSKQQLLEQNSYPKPIGKRTRKLLRCTTVQCPEDVCNNR